jgi:serine/threonine protein kinase/tetratricopeptide (TPR) repeat protein
MTSANRCWQADHRPALFASAAPRAVGRSPARSDALFSAAGRHDLAPQEGAMSDQPGDRPQKSDPTLSLPSGTAPNEDSLTVRRDTVSSAEATTLKRGLAGDPEATTEHPGIAALTQETARSPGQRPPTRVAGYDVLEELGRGSMGIVYKARQRGLNRIVALKMILAGSYASARDLARFKIEAEAIAHLQHANIVQIHEVGEHDGMPFFSLEFVEGGSLARMINGTPQPVRQAAGWLLQLAGAMEAAHRAGVIHRDLKPGNILLSLSGDAESAERSATKGGTEWQSVLPEDSASPLRLNELVPKITDFGLAKRLEEESGQTRSDTILGTPSYMAPEQAEGRVKDVGPRSDVYSLGAILYELLTGRPPFRGESIMETLSQVRTQEPVAPSQLQPKTPKDLETICLKCLAKEPGKRYPSAGELADDLRRYLAGEPIRARPISTAGRLVRWCRRNPKVAALTGIVAALLVTIAAGSAAFAVQLRSRNEELAQANRDLEISIHKTEEARQEAVKHADATVVKHERAIHHLSALGESVLKAVQKRSRSKRPESEGLQLQEEVLASIRFVTEHMASETAGGTTAINARLVVFQRMGDLLMRLGRGDEAAEQFEQAYKAALRIAEQRPNDDKSRANLGVILMRLGKVALNLRGDAEAARGYFARGRKLQQDVADHPRSKTYTPLRNTILLSHYDMQLGQAVLALGQPAAAREHFLEAAKRRQNWFDQEPASIEAIGYLAEAHLFLGVTASHLEDKKAAVEGFSKCLNICRQLIKKKPGAVDFKRDLADTLGCIGDARLRLGKKADACKDYEEARKAIEVAVLGDPTNLAYQVLQAQTWERLALALPPEKHSEAKALLEEALKLREQLAEGEPTNLPHQAAYMVALARCGKVKQAARIAETLRKAGPDRPALLLPVAACHALCGAASREPAAKRGHSNKALESLSKAVAHGYRDAVVLRTDPDLEAVRQESGFKALLKKCNAK